MTTISVSEVLKVSGSFSAQQLPIRAADDVAGGDTMQMTLEKAIEIIADEFQVNAASELVRDPKPRAIESIAYEYGRLEALDWCLSLLANNYRAPIYAHKTFRMKCWETPISVRPFAELVARRRRNAQKQLKAVNE